MPCLLIPARSARVPGANSALTWKLRHRNMRDASLVKTGRIKLFVDTAMDCLSRQRATVHQ
jgi:hypothetical protein